MTSIRQAFKRRAESALAAGGAKKLFARRRRGKALILAYHGIVPDGEAAIGEASLFVNRSEFAAQLDRLVKDFLVVPLAEIDCQPDGEPRIAITFDDAYQGAVEIGVRELVDRELPATIFVAPGRLDRHVFWWDALAGARGTLDEILRARALEQFSGVDEAVREWAKTKSDASNFAIPDFARSSTESELHAAARHPGITLGSHTWSHPNLSRLPASQVTAELTRSRDWLTERFGASAIPWMAYPYGLSSPLVREIASEHYVGALAISGGWHRASDVSSFSRPRLSVSRGLSLNGFTARLMGALQ